MKVQRDAEADPSRPPRPANGRGATERSSSLEKMLALLDVFTSAAPVWSMEELMRYSGTSVSTCYRYIKALAKAGLLTPVDGGSYVLGPRILELDRQIRLNDPLYTAGLPVLRQLTRETGHTGLLCVLFSNSVMCVHQEHADGAPDGLFSRGERRPLFLAAASKIILAHLPSHQLRALFAKHRTSIAAAGLGSDWDQFRNRLKAMREHGYAMTTGEFQTGITGISAPIFNRNGQVLGSVSVAFSAELLRPRDEPRLTGTIVEAGRAITQRVSTADRMMDRSARAIR